MPARPSLREATRFWLKLGLISFGGPGGQIAIMHEELVERKRWVTEKQFLQALNFCMLLPGPEAQQLATYVGWLLHRTVGGLIAGGLFVLPSAVLLWLLSWFYLAFGATSHSTGVLAGLRAAVLAIVVVATIRIGSRVLKRRVWWAVAGGGFVAIYFFNTPFPLVVAAAAIAGCLAGEPAETDGRESGPRADDTSRPSVRRGLKVAGIGLAVWWIPLFLVGWIFGAAHTLFQQGIFFSKAAMVTFGGAYAVLPYVSQQAVERFAWLSPEQMMDGLALAETTPGPLVIVLQFVGFVGAFQHPGTLPPLLAATLGSAVTVWATFVPCFLWIFLGAPYIQKLHDHARLQAALTGVTAAVVGVILNLAVWFAGHALWSAETGVQWGVLALTAVAFVALFRFKVNLIAIVFACGLLGWLGSLIPG